MNTLLITNAKIVNEGLISIADVLIERDIIKRIYLKKSFSENSNLNSDKTIDAQGRYLFPGVIDCHVHFRDPGLTHKADIYSESKAAVAGGVTSYLEMPNTMPFVDSNILVDEKIKIASEKSLANFSFFSGATSNNIEELKNINKSKTCGVKLFMGCSTGDMLVDDLNVLNDVFSLSSKILAVHCEDEIIIKNNFNELKTKYGENIPIGCHSYIRSEEACLKSTKFAIELANKNNTRLHITHISTEKELDLIDGNIDLINKKITTEVSVHHLLFDDKDYDKYENLIKCNPSIKTKNDKDALLNGLINDKIDIIATDHAPHTIEEKQKKYISAPSGIPMVQFSLVAMLELYHEKKISIEKIIEKMCHAPALCYGIKNRGFIKENYIADLVLVDIDSPWVVEKSKIISKCGWSPFENKTFNSKVICTFVNGNIVFDNGKFDELIKGKLLDFYE